MHGISNKKIPKKIVHFLVRQCFPEMIGQNRNLNLEIFKHLIYYLLTFYKKNNNKQRIEINKIAIFTFLCHHNRGVDGFALVVIATHIGSSVIVLAEILEHQNFIIKMVTTWTQIFSPPDHGVVSYFDRRSIFVLAMPT